MPVTSGKLATARSLIIVGLVLVFVFPGLGVLILPTVIAERSQWGGLLWMSAWALPVALVYLNERVQEVDGDQLTTRMHRSTRVRSLCDVVSVRPAPLYFPAAAVRFDDGSKVLLTPRNGLLDAALAAVPTQSVFLPHGNWLRSRRIVWFVAVVAAGVGDSM